MQGGMTWVWLVGAVSLLLPSAGAAQVTVSGIAFTVDGSGKYQPQPNVQIQAYRNMAPLLSRPVVTDAKGEFSFTVKEGEPFDVLFYGAKLVPNLTQIAGVKASANRVQVALLDPKQYAESRKGQEVPLEQKVGCIARELPRDDRTATMLREDFRIRQ
jgi:hypothetical protein